MSTTTYLNDDESLDSTIKTFAKTLGVASQYMESGSILPNSEPLPAELDRVLADQGALVNPANTVGLYWDVENYDPPGADVIEAINTPATEAFPHGHIGSAAVTFKNENHTSTVSKDYVDQVESLYGVDLVDNPGSVLLHEEADSWYPIRIDSPTEDNFVLIAPRLTGDDRR